MQNQFFNWTKCPSGCSMTCESQAFNSNCSGFEQFDASSPRYVMVCPNLCSYDIGDCANAVFELGVDWDRGPTRARGCDRFVLRFQNCTVFTANGDSCWYEPASTTSTSAPSSTSPTTTSTTSTSSFFVEAADSTPSFGPSSTTPELVEEVARASSEINGTVALVVSVLLCMFIMLVLLALFRVKRLRDQLASVRSHIDYSGSSYVAYGSLATSSSKNRDQDMSSGFSDGNIVEYRDGLVLLKEMPDADYFSFSGKRLRAQMSLTKKSLGLSGSFSNVYMVTLESADGSKKDFAMKVYRKEELALAKKGFFASILMSHASSVFLCALMVDPSTGFTVMPYMNCETMKTFAFLSIDEFLDAYRQCLSAVVLIEKQGIFHLDLNQGNILIQREQPLLVKIIDGDFSSRSNVVPSDLRIHPSFQVAWLGQSDGNERSVDKDMLLLSFGFKSKDLLAKDPFFMTTEWRQRIIDDLFCEERLLHRHSKSCQEVWKI